MDLKPTSNKDQLGLVFIYSGEYAERVIRNLINDPSFCKACGLYCDYCKYNAHSFVHNIQAAIPLKSPSELPHLIDKPGKYMPKRIPEADLCIASGIHKDLLLELPTDLQKAGIKGLIVPVEDFTEVPSGLRKQIQDRCQELEVESAFPKPFCSLEPRKEKPTISRLVTELKVGRPSLEITTVKRGKKEVIESTVVKRSAPCGSTWYVARKLIGVETRKRMLHDTVAKAHHSYPCTATMSVDPEEKEPILHIGGYIIREEVEKALEATS